MGHSVLARDLAARCSLSYIRHDTGREGIWVDDHVVNDMPASEQDEAGGQECAEKARQLTAPFCHSDCG
jgi:hypothetical protein